MKKIGNKNARKYGTFATKFDGREAPIRRMYGVIHRVRSDQGGDELPETMERTIKNYGITEYRIDCLFVDLVEAQRQGAEWPEWKEKILMRWIALNLAHAQALGLERKAKQVPALQDYIAKRAAQRAE